MPATLTTPDLTSLAAVSDVRLPVALLALDPISHGAGNAGNTQLLRTMPHIWQGRPVEVPCVSGNSIRHRLRDALAWHLVRTLDVPEMGFARRVVDLLWSGGALTSTGNKADLAAVRKVAHLLLGTSTLGYSAKSDIVAGTLWVNYAHLVCRENSNRMPPALLGHPHAGLPMTVFRGKAFGTRHDVSGSPASRYIRIETADDLLGSVAREPDRPQQMIYDMQVVKPGSVLYSGLELQAPTIGHVAALATAIDEAAPVTAGVREIHLGGKRSVGYGRCALYGNWDSAFARHGGMDVLRRAYETHMRDNRDAILALMPEMVG